MKPYLFPLILFLLLAPIATFAEEDIIEKDINYTVVKGDNGNIIEGKLGLGWEHIAVANSMDPYAPLEVGQILKVKFRRIIPFKIDNGIVINIPDKTLYRFSDGRLKDYYFIAAGKPTWQTPTGEFSITAKAKDPTWYVPLSIQKEMEEEEKEVLVEVPAGAENPLGRYWLKLSIKGVGLHGTNAPQSIYKFRSHGCMRLRPEVAELLYKTVAVGTKGIIIYEPIKIFKTPDGKILIEVYRDAYKKGIDYNKKISAKLNELNVSDRVDRNKVKEAIDKKDGIVRDVTIGR